MRLRSDFIVPSLALLLCLGVAAAPQAAENKFNLKEGAKGKNCLSCHDNFEEILKKPFVHTPLKNWDCTGCHNPHASSHGKFLDAEAEEICVSCHADIFPDKPASSHKVAVEGGCVKCHDPHAAANRANLHVGGNGLCFGCHKAMGAKVGAAKFKHTPVEKGCVSCHNPHASADGPVLLKEAVPGLCLKCHDPNRQVFQKQHGDYEVAKAQCTSCHDPHGSGRKGLFYDTVHAPFDKKMCRQCHEQPTAEKPFKVKADGYKLCMGCHNNMVNEALLKRRTHWPIVDRVGCLNCHSPHASPEAGLLKKPMTAVCAQCHADTVEWHASLKVKHSPIAEGQCTACHAPHAANQVFLLKEPSVITVCNGCHEWGKHSTHPLGPDFKDPRNPNLTVDCLSCHRSHGTGHDKLMHAASQTELCTNCHTKFGR